MCFVYVVRQGTVLGISGGSMTLKYPDSTSESIPKCLVEGISVFANVVMTTPFVNYCLQSNTNVGFFSKDGRYKGCLSGIEGYNSERLRKQVTLSADESFSLAFSKRIIQAKINNQIVVSKRYSTKDETYINLNIKMKYLYKNKITDCITINQLIGFEGVTSRYYFKTLSLAMTDDFSFSRRTRRPAMDPVNCMLNIGYSVLSKEIYGELINRNLNPYIGFMHQDKNGHPALVSDLMEEWRSVIVDSLIMSLIRCKEIKGEDFSYLDGGCVISDKGLKILLSGLERKMESKSNYLKYFDKRVSFREAIWHQADRLSRAIDANDTSIYSPVTVR